jgi:hypothetical protein
LKPGGVTHFRQDKRECDVISSHGIRVNVFFDKHLKATPSSGRCTVWWVGVVLMGQIDTRPWGERSFYLSESFGSPLCFVDAPTLFTGGRE